MDLSPSLEDIFPKKEIHDFIFPAKVDYNTAEPMS